MGDDDFAMTKTKTYEELRQAAADSWTRNTSAHAARMQTMAEQIAQSPDVQEAPTLGSQWANELVVCACGGHVYTTIRYACINGKKHRTEVECIACHARNTWDFELNRWLAT